MQKIMHLMASNFYGGPEKQIVEHLVRLNKSKYIGTLTSYIENDKSNELLLFAKKKGVKNFGIKISGPLDKRAVLDLNTLLKKEKVNLLVTHGFKATVLGWIVARYNKIHILAYSRGYTAEDLKVRFYEWLERRVLRRVDGIISVSEGQKRKLNSYGIRNKNIWVVHNAIGNYVKSNMISPHLKEDVFNKLGIPHNAKMVVTAGRLSPEKGYQYLIDAIHHISKKINNTYFVFCGSGVCEEELQKQAKRLNIDDVCRFVGFRRDIMKIFKQMDIFVLPSLTEGLPNVVLEAFACSKPVIATEVGGVPEIVKDRYNGLLVPPACPELLGDKIYELLDSEDMRSDYGKNGLDTVKSEFTFEEQTDKLQDIYQMQLNGS